MTKSERREKMSEAMKKYWIGVRLMREAKNANHEKSNNNPSPNVGPYCTWCGSKIKAEAR